MADDWMMEYEAKRHAERKSAQKRLRTVCEMLERVGVERVEVDYDGEGDSGSVQEVRFTPEPSAGMPDGLEEVITEAAYHLLPDGWEIDGGSYGTLQIDVCQRRINRDHGWRIIETETDREEFAL